MQDNDKEYTSSETESGIKSYNYILIRIIKLKAPVRDDYASTYAKQLENMENHV